MLNSTISTREEIGEISFILVRDSTPKVQTTLPLYVCDNYNGTPRDSAQEKAVDAHLEALTNSTLFASFSRIPATGSGNEIESKTEDPPVQNTHPNSSPQSSPRINFALNPGSINIEATVNLAPLTFVNVPIDLDASVNLGTSLDADSTVNLNASINPESYCSVVERNTVAEVPEIKEEFGAASGVFNPNSVIKEVFWGEKVTRETSIGVLEGLDEVMVEILQAQAQLSTIGDFASLPTVHPDTYSFLVDTGLIPGIQQLIQNCSNLMTFYNQNIQIPSPIVVNQENTVVIVPEPQEEETREELLINPFGYVEIFRQIEGIKEDNLVTWLHKNAYIFTLGELAHFPVDYPGIYSQLKIFGGLGGPLDDYIECCKKVVGSYRRAVKDGESFDWYRLEYDEDSLEDVKLATIYGQLWLQRVDPIVLANC